MPLPLNRSAAVRFYRDLANDIRENDRPSQVELTGALEGAAHRVEADGKRIESLQRENEELKAAIKQSVTRASCVQCADMEQQIKELRIKLHNQAAKAEEQAFMWRERLEKAEASAITPEMREKIRRALEIGLGNDPKMSERVFRELLGEQG